MFWGYFKISLEAAGQIFLLGAIGYFLFKKGILGQQGLNSLSRLVVELTLPFLIFTQLIRDFSFALYRNWWFFPLLSLIIALAGFILGALFLGFISEKDKRLQFLALVAFQNSGYLPLVLTASLLPQDKAGIMFIYIFLFLLGFNLLIWSLGAYMLSFNRLKKFELGSLFSPPVIATLISLLFVFMGWNKFIPNLLTKPLRMVGDCTLPLAMMVVGGNLAQVKVALHHKGVIWMCLAKMIILPGLGLWLVLWLRLPELLGLLILMQLMMPPATSLSVITRYFNREDSFVSEGIFWGHFLGLITLPIFLSLYFSLFMLK